MKIQKCDRDKSQYNADREAREYSVTELLFSETIGDTRLHRIIGHHGYQNRRGSNQETHLSWLRSSRVDIIDSIHIGKPREETDKVTRYLEWDNILVDLSKLRDELDDNNESREL